VESGTELHTLAGHSASVTGVAVSRDGRRVVSASVDKTLKVWDLESGAKLHTDRAFQCGF
jgi:WD40 repeat protein